MSLSAEQQVLTFLKENPVWFAAADLQRRDFRNKNNTLASPKAISRRLQELAEGEHALIEVEYRGKNAFYRIKQAHIKKVQKVTYLPNGSVRVEMIPINA